MAKKVADRLFAPPMTFLPDQLKTVVNTGRDYVQRVMNMMMDLDIPGKCDRDNPIECMAEQVADQLFTPPMTFLPDQLKAVVNAGQESVHRLFSMMTDLLNTADCDRSNTFDCMAQHVFHWLPQPLHTVVNAGQEGVDRVFAMIRDLLNTPHCDRGNTFDCMAQHVFHWLPQPLHTVVNSGQESVHRVFSMMTDLLNTAHCDRGNTFDCMAKRVATYVMQFEPPLNWLPEPIKRVAAHTQEAVDRLFQMIHVLLNTAHCNRADSFHCMAKLVANHVMAFAPPMNFLPAQLHTVVNAGQESVHRLFSMMTDLLNTADCDRSNTFDCMAQHVFHWLPQPLHTVVNAGQEGVDRVFAMIRDLLNTPHCDRGNVFHCMAKRVASYVMQFEPPLNSMPGPVVVLAGSNVNSVKSLMAMGDDLMHCQNLESGHEVMKCLGYKIIERVPPLSYLNQLGDVIPEYLETFAKAATSLAMKALRGGTSLIEKASVSQFPPVGNMPVRHQQGNLVVEVHSQEMHPSLLQFFSGQGKQGVPVPEFEDGGDVHLANLITQFHGREADSGSCLAFAPRTKTGAHVGNHQEATKDDWTTAKKEDFVQLEPWAVPCDNTWMKERDFWPALRGCMLANLIAITKLSRLFPREYAVSRNL